MNTISNMADVLLDFFGKKAQQISTGSGFTQRRSKLTGEKFASALILGFLNNPLASLEDICQLLKRGKVKITKQGLHERFNGRSVHFMEQLFQESIHRFKDKSANLIDLLKPFQSINILDSTGFKLPETLKEEFKGHGGSAPKAGLKLQVMIDYLSGIDKLWVTGATRNDQGFQHHLSCIKPGSLYLQDLGYFALDSFKKIQSEGSYFISRFLKKTLVFSRDGQEIDLLYELKRESFRFERDVCIGKESRFLVRMIAERVPKEVAEKRVREEIAYGKRKGYTPCQRSLELMGWSIYITNIAPTLLTLEQVFLVYKLRWQIEIFLSCLRVSFQFTKCQGKIAKEYYASFMQN